MNFYYFTKLYIQETELLTNSVTGITRINSPILNAIQQEHKESLNQPQFDKHFSLNEMLKLTDFSAHLWFLCRVSVVYCLAFRGFVFLTGCYDVMSAFVNYFLW